jgi:hypothetical protein
VNPIYLRFIPSIIVVASTIAWRFDWIGQTLWIVLLVISFIAHVAFSVLFFRIRREVFLRQREERLRNTSRNEP